MFDNLKNPEAELLDQVMDSASTGLFLIDSNGLIIYCNPLLSKLIKAPASQFLSQPYTAMLDKIAVLSCDPQQTLHDVALALRYLEQPEGHANLAAPHKFCVTTYGAP